jgi:hypothetical protein
VVVVQVVVRLIIPIRRKLGRVAQAGSMAAVAAAQTGIRRQRVAMAHRV